MQEQWKDISDGYQVSDQGDVRSFRLCKAGKILSKHKDEDGYNKVSLRENGRDIEKRVARLVAQAFPEICGEWFEGCQVNHKNEVKTDDRAVNLEVCTPRYNVLYSQKPMSGRRTQEKYPVKQMLDGKEINIYKSMRFAAEETGISYPRIRKCALGLSKSAGGYQWVLL